jgi:hypothetical protein
MRIGALARAELLSASAAAADRGPGLIQPTQMSTRTAVVTTLDRLTRWFPV